MPSKELKLDLWAAVTEGQPQAKPRLEGTELLDFWPSSSV